MWILVPYGIFRLTSPFVGGGNPQANSKGRCLALVVDESLAGRGKETVHSGFIDIETFIPTFALNGPKIALNSLCHQINTGILTANILFVREFVP